jgi:hypothetical protein
MNIRSSCELHDTLERITIAHHINHREEVQKEEAIVLLHMKRS